MFNRTSPIDRLKTSRGVSRALDCGSARGYGALESLAATEIMIDEVADALGGDPIEFRHRNVLKTGMKNAQGAAPLGTQRAEALL